MAESLHQANAAMTRIELPWPDRALHPNGRPAHWAVKAKAAKSAKNYAWGVTRNWLGSDKKAWERANLHWQFHPKTKHPIDADNAIAACKYYQDGIALAIGIDDSLFNVTYSIAEPVKGGLVVVTIEESKND